MKRIAVDNMMLDGMANVMLAVMPAGEIGMLGRAAGEVSHLPQIFWSGKRAFAAAREYAAEHGAATLEDSAVGQILQKGNFDKSAWIQASRMYAWFAKGEVHVFLDNPRAESVWATIEEPSLRMNPDVTNIVIHNLAP